MSLEVAPSNTKVRSDAKASAQRLAVPTRSNTKVCSGDTITSNTRYAATAARDPSERKCCSTSIQHNLIGSVE
jgi:hypothetical protein